MNKLAATTLATLATLGLATTVHAQSGHFIESGAGAPVCTDTGTTVTCTGKVAGLGGTTFEITVTAPGVAEVECANPAGNVAPGQDTEVDVTGSTGPLPTPRNGQYRFTTTSDTPVLPSVPTCPNPQWTPHVVDVAFGDATLTLYEDGAQVDQVVVSVG